MARKVYSQQFKDEACKLVMEQGYDHRPGFARGEQVVQDEVHPALGRPAPFVLAHAVLEVEHRVTRARGFPFRVGMLWSLSHPWTVVADLPNFSAMAAMLSPWVR